MDLQPIRTLLRRRHVQATHYDGCWAEHIDCATRTLLTEVERLHSWAGLMSLLDEHYPADVFTGDSDDPGPRIVALTREVERLRAAVEPREHTCRGRVLAPSATVQCNVCGATWDADR